MSGPTALPENVSVILASQNARGRTRVAAQVATGLESIITIDICGALPFRTFFNAYVRALTIRACPPNSGATSGSFCLTTRFGHAGENDAALAAGRGTACANWS